jgi:protein-L-isoaspartate(D-aspartate) O-methyltransferase
MDMEKARFNMVEQQIRPWGVTDTSVLNLLFSIKRENFVPQAYKKMAFSDFEIPLPGGQKMLCPRLEARLVAALAIKRTDKVLEIGTGSGYVTALLAKLADFVYSVEIDEQNKQLATHNLTSAGINNISLIQGNGINGLPKKAPFDKIFVGGGIITIPDSFKKQLKVGGKLVGFTGTKPVMQAVLIEKINETTYRERKLFETDVDYLISANIKKFKF